MPRALLVEKDVTASTNDDARALALQGAPAGTAVMARRQTRGRGRAGRMFVSPEGGLYVSVVLRPAMPPARWSLLPLAVAAECAAVLRAYGFAADVKWPNDLLIGGRKVAGVLVESRFGAEAFAIAGIGLNVAAAPLPEATCLAEHGAPPPLRALADAIARGLVARADALGREGPAATLEELRASCVTLGRKVSWEMGSGVAVDVADDGALVVEMEDGARARIVAGDVKLTQFGHGAPEA